MDLPKEYIEYVSSDGIKEGEADFEFGGYFRLEPLENLSVVNKEIEIEEYAPGFVAFASDGGGEVFVFDHEGKIYLMPLIGMDSNEAMLVAECWKDYEKQILPEA